MSAAPSLLVLVRHAESDRNRIKKDHVFYPDDESRRPLKGIPDHHIRLTKEGVLHAERAGQALRKRFGTFDRAYHSGYRRTVGTLDGILKAYPDKERKKTRVAVNPFIRERDPGYAYEMTQNEVEQAFPWFLPYWRTFGGFFARPVGGESLAQVADRAQLFLDTLSREAAGKKVLAVTHIGVMRCLRFLIEGWDYEKAAAWPVGESPKNCGTLIYAYDRAKKRLLLRENLPIFP